MKDTMRKLRVAAQAESVLLKLKTRRAIRSALFVALALVFALLAIRVINGAAFEALKTSWGALKAGLVVGGVDLVIAALLVRWGLREKSDGDEERLAQQVREMTYASVSDDLEEARIELQGFVADVRRIRHAVGIFTSGVGGPLNLAVDFLSSILDAGKIPTADEKVGPPVDSKP
jgi:hypothetical protein